MKLPLLYSDELKGFYKSKVMLFLWVGLPIVAVLFRFVQYGSSGQAIPFTVISALVVSSLAGTLAAVMLAVSIINEKNRHVYELFLIRPLKRRDIVLAKFLSVYTCVAVASLIAVAVGVAADYTTANAFPPTILNDTAQSLAISLSMVAVSCSAGVLIGIASPTVLVGAILVIYGGNQISVIPLVPTMLNLPEAPLFTVALAAAVAASLLISAVALFERKQF
ncbi:MAG: ABC-2 transporter permease [Candidatus Bathyarchaeota archaeon]|nr:ABC-2 transporter permease [Candidatus Bathyarchaeota archaeon]